MLKKVKSECIRHTLCLLHQTVDIFHYFMNLREKIQWASEKTTDCKLQKSGAGVIKFVKLKEK